MIEGLYLTEKDKIKKVIITPKESISTTVWNNRKQELADLLDIEYKNVLVVPDCKISLIIETD